MAGERTEHEENKAGAEAPKPRPARTPEEKLGRALGWLAGKAVVTVRKTKIWQETQQRFEQELHGQDDERHPSRAQEKPQESR
jgi:hypothetical protein